MEKHGKIGNKMEQDGKTLGKNHGNTMGKIMENLGISWETNVQILGKPWMN